MKKNKLFILMGALLILTVAMFTGCAGEQAPAPEDAGMGETVLGSFAAEDLHGNSVTEEVFVGKKVTMVNVWATFCGPCIDEMPDLGKLNEEYAEQGFQVVGVVLDVFDREGNVLDEELTVAKQIVSDTQASYLHIVPSKDMLAGRLATVTGVPTTYFVDEEGIQIGKAYEGSRSKEAWEEIIKPMLESIEK